MEIHHGYDPWKSQGGTESVFGHADLHANLKKGKTYQEILDWADANPDKMSHGIKNRPGGGGLYDEIAAAAARERSNKRSSAPEVQYIDQSGSTGSTDIPDTEYVFDRNSGSDADSYLQEKLDQLKGGTYNFENRASVDNRTATNIGSGNRFGDYTNIGNNNSYTDINQDNAYSLDLGNKKSRYEEDWLKAK